MSVIASIPPDFVGLLRKKRAGLLLIVIASHDPPVRGMTKQSLHHRMSAKEIASVVALPRNDGWDASFLRGSDGAQTRTNKAISLAE
ncbi:MAG: hypothetical protein C4532_07940 [Candidatus Abyssobacteria bacterium SURF_17]|uniref:Uncharacterized protein n=1 Tax=Candidatus Abyssobacteria bacterium SURF_17 TaxID=2093361 RepID=A0A419F092_9BACT|nr:MAG: hypothetical protein C4532_07940 [Candidatus Abyssubacteria bacterium SURF_17]